MRGADIVRSELVKDIGCGFLLAGLLALAVCISAGVVLS